jgi:hypothetical protein
MFDEELAAKYQMLPFRRMSLCIDRFLLQKKVARACVSCHGEELICRITKMLSLQISAITLIDYQPAMYCRWQSRYRRNGGGLWVVIEKRLRTIAELSRAVYKSAHPAPV